MLLDRWCAWAQRCRIPGFVKLNRTIREPDIANQLGLTKQRILEALWDAYQRALVPDGKQLSVAVKCLELLMRHRGMLTDRHQVEHHDVVYTLDLGDGLRGSGDEPDEPAL